MSHMTVCVDNSVPPKERRVRVRHPLGALAYLDIGADNGGIILNVSEEGLALQAAGPLDQQKEISLRIQLPRLEKPIETAARIVWLGQSNRQAGVRFLALPAAARAQIQEWMGSEPTPGSSEGQPTDDSRAARAAVPLPEQTQDSQREKWLSLMADFAAHQSARPAVPGADSDALAGVPAAPVLHPRPEIVSREFGKRKQQEANAPAIEAPIVRRPYTQEQAATAAKPRTSGSPVSTGSGALSNLLAPPPAIPGSTILAPSSGFPAKTGMDAMEAARNAVRQAAEAAVRRTRARNQISVLAAIVLFSILCFGIGTWVGPLVNRQLAPPVIATPAPPVTSLESTTTPSMNASKLDEAIHARSSEKKRSERSYTSLAAESRQHKSAPPVSPADSAAAELPRRVEVSAPLAVNPSPGQPIQSAQNTPTMQPSPVDFVPEPAGPRVVDGRVLKPSDRFNPCHLSYRVEPTYPLEAQQQGLQGTVKIHLVIAADGSISSEKLISGPSQLAPAALEAAKYWRYFPALLNGEPVQTEKDVEVPFHLPR